jgi:hypothetical protein
MNNLKHAVEETGRFLDAFSMLEAGADVRQLASCPWPPLTLGTVQALYELGRDIQETADEYGPEAVARALAR